MKIAVYSDLHGNYQATKAILEDINNNKFDEVICLGDIIGLGPNSKETLELVLNSNSEIILGNHDLYYRDGLEIDNKITDKNEIHHHQWIHNSIKEYKSKNEFNYPLKKELNVDGLKILFQHYILNNDLEKDKFPFERISINNIEDMEYYCENMNCDYMFIGHEHKSFEIHKNNKHLICVGSSGCVKDDKTFYTIIDINDKKVNILKKEIKYDRESFIHNLKMHKYPDNEVISKIFFGVEN